MPMYELMVVDIILFMVVALLTIPTVGAYYAYTRGRSFWFWFAVGTIFPVFSYFILIFLPDKSNPIDPDLEKLRIDLGVLGISPDLPADDPLSYQIKNASVRTIKFVRKASVWQNEPVIEPQIDGASLADWVKQAELPYAKTAQVMAGAYEGLAESKMGYPELYLYGNQGETPRIILLQSSKEGNPEWNWEAEIKVYRRVVVWHNFRQTTMKEFWRYDRLGIFVFDRLQYFDAVHEIQMVK